MIGKLLLAGMITVAAVYSVVVSFRECQFTSGSPFNGVFALVDADVPYDCNAVPQEQLIGFTPADLYIFQRPEWWHGRGVRHRAIFLALERPGLLIRAQTRRGEAIELVVERKRDGFRAHCRGNHTGKRGSRQAPAPSRQAQLFPVPGRNEGALACAFETKTGRLNAIFAVPSASVLQWFETSERTGERRVRNVQGLVRGLDVGPGVVERAGRERGAPRPRCAPGSDSSSSTRPASSVPDNPAGSPGSAPPSAR